MCYLLQGSCNECQMLSSFHSGKENHIGMLCFKNKNDLCESLQYKKNQILVTLHHSHDLGIKTDIMLL
jgi:hypothetical protein